MKRLIIIIILAVMVYLVYEEQTSSKWVTEDYSQSYEANDIFTVYKTNIK